MGYKSVACAVAVMVSTACSSSGPGNPSIKDYIVAVRTSNGAVEASYRNGNPPSAGTGPAIVAKALGAFIFGGTAPVQVSSSSPFSKVIVSLPGVSGYWELPLTQTTRAAIFLTLKQDLPSSSFGISYAASNGGPVGSYDNMPVGVTPVGTGDVQVSISWDVLSDLDLHVLDPSGEHIYYKNPISSSGGELDLDSNPACAIDGVNNENVTWPTGRAPAGQYKVYVNLYASCGTTVTTYSVTVTRRGQVPQVFFGTVSTASTTSIGTLVATLTN